LVKGYAPRLPQGMMPIPHTHYVPSLRKEEAMAVLKQSQETMMKSFEHSQRMLEDMFFKL